MSFVIPPLVAITDKIIPRYPVIPEQQDSPIATSYLGTPIYAQLEFSTEGIESEIGSPNALNPSEGARNLILETVLITVIQSKNIIKTAIQGRNGTVKEYISDGDFQINIIGSIVSPFALVYPKDEVDLLIRYCKVNREIGVICEFLGQFGIEYVVIENYTVSEKLGSRNEVPFELTCYSDEPIEFRLNA
jgi:hypothetical protein